MARAYWLSIDEKHLDCSKRPINLRQTQRLFGGVSFSHLNIWRRIIGPRFQTKHFPLACFQVLDLNWELEKVRDDHEVGASSFS